MNGFLRVLKPPGMTSHDVVAVLRRLLHTRAIGHTGTLDPAAAGLLVIAVGDATRLGEYLLDSDKGYRAEISLGLTTDTADAEGEVLSRFSAAHWSRREVASACATLTGELAMRPPRHSAVRVGGRKLYELTRAGHATEAPERAVRVHEFRLLDFTPGEVARALVHVECSKGTYVRSLAEMLGQALGCGGMLSFLLRTRVGDHDLTQAVTLEELAVNPQVWLISPAEALPHLPQVMVTTDQATALAHGQAVAAPGELGEGPALVTHPDGELLCLAHLEQGLLRPRKVFVQP